MQVCGRMDASVGTVVTEVLGGDGGGEIGTSGVELRQGLCQFFRVCL